jgi:modulator of FtsH protease HflK
MAYKSNRDFPGNPFGLDEVKKFAGYLWIAPVVFVLWAILSTYYTVPADSVGVVLRFGKYADTQQPGLHFKLPFGIDEVELVAVKRTHKLEFGFGTRGGTNVDQVGDDPIAEKSMVTGDLNAALVEWVVQYQVDDPKLFLFHAMEPASTLRDLSEATMREIVGDRTVDEVITVGRQEIEDRSLVRLKELSKNYQLGLAINQVQLKNVNPPREVQASFNEVNNAQQDRENMINLANGEYNKAVPRAEGEAAQKISVAEGYKLKRVNEAMGDAGAFTAVYEEYRKAPDVTRKRMLLETMADVLPTIRQTTIVDEKVTQLLPLVQPAGTGVAK